MKINFFIIINNKKMSTPNKITVQELKNIQETINKWAPIIFHHPDEKYYPVSIEWLMANSALIDYTDPKNPVSVSPVTNQDIYDLSKKHNFEFVRGGTILFSFGSELHKGEHPTRNIPCYVLVREVEGKVHITYIFLYAYNGEYPILGLLNAGQHPADLEHLTVELTQQGQLTRVMYSAHGTKDGRWVAAKDVPMENGRLIAYMALNGHGLYPKEGIAFRLGGLANDYLGRGASWDPKPQLIFLPNDINFDVNTMGWVAFNGYFGGEARPGNTDGIAPLIDKGWIRGTDILDESQLNPPIIFSNTVGNVLINVKNIIVFIIVYFMIFNLLKLIDKYVFDPTDGEYGLKEHATTIAIFLILFVIIKMIATKIIKKFVPS
jgi:hypothetical protein